MPRTQWTWLSPGSKERNWSPASSAFKDPDLIPLLNDPLVEVLTQEQPQDGGDEEGEDSPSMAELAQQKNSHVGVTDKENPTTTIPVEGQGTPQAS